MSGFEIETRVQAAQATLDEWRDKPFRLGRRDCARMVAWHLRRMGRPARLPPSGTYSTARSAKAALEARGYRDLLEAMDAFGFARIPPAAALPGDVLAIPSGEDIGCLMVALSNGRAIGYYDGGDGATVLQPLEYLAAWRVVPKVKAA